MNNSWKVLATRLSSPALIAYTGIAELKTEIESVDIPPGSQWEVCGWSRKIMSKVPNFFQFFRDLEEVLKEEERKWSPPRPAIYSKIHRKRRGWCPDSDASEDESVCGSWGFRLPANTNKKCRAMLSSLVREVLELQGDALNDLSWQGGLAFAVKLTTMYCP
jgi:hypothetical protein